MADQFLIDIAVTELDELIDGLQAVVNKGGFDPTHKDMMWFLKGWIKVAMNANHPEYFKQAPAYWAMKRDAPPMNGSRSKQLVKDLDAFRTMLQNHKQTHGDYFTRVDNGVRDLVWEYRKRLGPKPAADFENKLMILRSMSKEQFMKEKMFRMEQHA
jgi:hypothetical protein